MSRANQTDMSLQQLNLNIAMKLFFNIKGVKKADKGDFDDALECFSKAIELPPKDSLSYFNRDSVSIPFGDVEDARSDIETLETCGLIKILSRIYQIILCLSILLLFL